VSAFALILVLVSVAAVAAVIGITLFVRLRRSPILFTRDRIRAEELQTEARLAFITQQAISAIRDTARENMRRNLDAGNTP
jgi:hypothetical protein